MLPVPGMSLSLLPKLSVIETSPDSMEQQLCLSCGLCCNGVIFSDVRLKASDDPTRLRALGLPLSGQTLGSKKAVRKFDQPCAALEGPRCRIYADRPNHCRHFECLLLKSAKAGRMQPLAALKIIREAQARAAKVERLLKELGNKDEHFPLSARFRQTSANLEKGRLDEETADLYGELTVAVHDLNCLLSDAFYPGR
jgi:Fe-S-cluster containining protein